MKFIAPALEPSIKNLEARGIAYEIVDTPTGTLDSNGNPVMRQTITIRSIPPEEQELNQFYSELVPCWFPECEELRARYHADITALNKDGQECQGCQKGAVMRKYEPLVRNAIRANKKHETGNTRTGKVSGPAAAGGKGTSKQTSMLRRAADRIAKIFGYSPSQRES